jgi:signal-transduction protein with cAMP-binding, CBS, and nucleotidyltransferase domain
MAGSDSTSTESAKHAPDIPLDALALDALELKRPLVVASDATVQTVAQAMLRAGRSTVVVGSWTVVTERDIARAVALGRPPTTPAAAIAGQAAPTVSGHTDVLKALAMMLSEQITEVVVTDSDMQVTGILSLGDAMELTLRHAGAPASVSALRESLGLEPHLG